MVRDLSEFLGKFVKDMVTGNEGLVTLISFDCHGWQMAELRYATSPHGETVEPYQANLLYLIPISTMGISVPLQVMREV